jgi:hypothetical protein
VQIGEQILKLLVAEGIDEFGHQVASVEDDGGYALVVGRCAAGQILLLVESLEPGPVERAIGVGVVAAGAVRDINLVSGSFLRSELAEGF